MGDLGEPLFAAEEESIIDMSLGLKADGDTLDESLMSTMLPPSAAESTLGDSRCSQNGMTISYPRTVSAFRLLEEEDDDDDEVFCGPPSDAEESGVWELRSLEVWGIGLVEPNKRRQPNNRTGAGANPGQGVRAAGQGGEGGEARAQDGTQQGQGGAAANPVSQVRGNFLIQPRGDMEGDNQKFICVFPIGLEDDQEFCLVKRILGKAGNNMRRIAEECAAKIRLRGIGSGFLEGSDGREANMPLQLNVSCTDFESYSGAVTRVETLLKDLYKHYRRYARSKGMEVPDVKVSLEEVRRDDLDLDLLTQKAQRTSSQRERDRRARELERRAQREGAAGVAPRREHSRERRGDGDDASVGDNSAGEQGDEVTPDTASVYSPGRQRVGTVPLVLPGGLPVPATPAGRRAAFRTGGAAAAAIVSAHAREVERQEREQAREDRERERLERERRRTEAAVSYTMPYGRNNWQATRASPKAASAPIGAGNPNSAGYASSRGAAGKPSATWVPSSATWVPAGSAKRKGKAAPPPPHGPPPDDYWKGGGKGKGKW